MPRSLRALCVALSLWTAGVLPAASATVTSTSGEVLVNRGSGFEALSVPIELPAGAQVSIPPGGSAFVRFAGGCEVQVTKRHWVIPKEPPCAGARWATITESAAAGLVNPPASSYDPTWLVTPVIIAGGGAAAIILLTQGGGGNDGRPISP
jgi:hypothetical protein